MNSAEFSHRIAFYVKEDIPFFFLIDFEKNKPIVLPISDCKSENIHFDFLAERSAETADDISLQADPVPFKTYEESFNTVKNGIHHGNSFLVNLTYPTPIHTKSSLASIYKHSKALYKLYYKDQFVVFSPERFIQIRQNKISTYPMKGTIMAHIPDAERILLNDKKEQYEHNTIVDLMRNDLSMVAQNVEVERFRYLSEIQTHKGIMLQTSSEISGDLPQGWESNFASMLLAMLPAGSITGAPKDKTVGIIRAAEPDQRGYYTGVFGTYKHGNVDSAVAIRYIEKDTDKQLHYRSGGGITFMSNAQEEYQELINKIYVPTR